jgi:hypothetical protein
MKSWKINFLPAAMLILRIMSGLVVGGRLPFLTEGNAVKDN